MNAEDRSEVAARFHEAWFGDGLIDDIIGRMALHATMQRLDRATAAGFEITYRPAGRVMRWEIEG